MDQLFAPWRIEWVKRDDLVSDIDSCLFCEAPEKDDDSRYLIVATSDHAFVMLNNYPYNPGHVMVIPYHHTGVFSELPAAVLLDHAQLKARAFEALTSAFDPDGFNAGLNLGSGSGGSIDDHLHTHIVPRWEGDTNFMPLISETKVIVQALEDTYTHLQAAFAKQPGAHLADDTDAVKLDLS